ncbi:hypothetical protein [uncultured Clostridium sp.]|uniref:hypothetical protein n=1 Tax=uncultured Clostridium sp. TaxID=59620 RepID=UPI0025EF23B2|nr:hypothetical protein [uncultured Clostridium sp.]
MKWSEARKTYPNKWIVFDSLKQHEEDNKLLIEDIAVIEVFDDINDAFKYYRMLHRQDKSRQLGFDDTRKDKLEYETERIGIIR